MTLYRIVVLGDGGVGKTALTIQVCCVLLISALSVPLRTGFRSPIKQQTYDPTIEDSYRKQVVIDDIPCILEILDTAGQEEYTVYFSIIYCRLRDQWIRDGQGFVLVYSITSKSTFERVDRFKEQILRVKDTDHAPIVLVHQNCF